MAAKFNSKFFRDQTEYKKEKAKILKLGPYVTYLTCF